MKTIGPTANRCILVIDTGRRGVEITMYIQLLDVMVLDLCIHREAHVSGNLTRLCDNVWGGGNVHLVYWLLIRPHNCY